MRILFWLSLPVMAPVIFLCPAVMMVVSSRFRRSGGSSVLPPVLVAYGLGVGVGVLQNDWIAGVLAGLVGVVTFWFGDDMRRVLIGVRWSYISESSEEDDDYDGTDLAE